MHGCVLDGIAVSRQQQEIVIHRPRHRRDLLLRWRAPSYYSSAPLTWDRWSRNV
ncbi:MULTISPECIES: hypothetical protein [Streptomyces]|uniref:hypothetical protein n=1 Tax=Streptomyces decoyicus TaxID=249567 RepID=UPI002E17D409|nr:hypothetical protein OG532_38925 [Streptomyces decoyicus]